MCNFVYVPRKSNVLCVTGPSVCKCVASSVTCVACLSHCLNIDCVKHNERISAWVALHHIEFVANRSLASY